MLEPHRAGGGRPLGRRIGQFEGLFHLQVGQALDFQNAAGENVLLALLLDGQQALADGIKGNGIDQVAQGDARLHGALETNQHAFRHVERHDAGGGGEGDQARSGREGDADGEPGVRVAAGSDGVGQQQTVHPGVDHPVTGTQGNAAAGGNEGRQFAVGFDVHQLGIGRGMAERLHHHVGREAQAGKVFQFVTGHRAGGVLRSDGGHPGFTIGAGTDPLAFRKTAGAADDLLGQGEALAGIGGHRRQAELGRRGQPQRLARLGGQAAPDDQRDAAAGPHFVEQDVGLHRELGDHRAVLQSLAVIGSQFDDVAHLHFRDVEFDRQRAGVFHGVVEDRGDLAAQTDAAEALVGDEGDVLAGEPQHRVGRRLTRRSGADHVAHIGDQMTFGRQLVQ